MRSSASVLAAALLLAACSGGAADVRPSLPVAATPAAAPLAYATYRETGLASWYGEEVAGNRTASGEMFDPKGVTAAHRTLPLGSWAEVTALDTGRSILVRINDRGPGRKDRIIDLSRGAARLLGADHHALAQVRVRALAAPPPGARSAAGLVLNQGRSSASETASANLASLRQTRAMLAPDGRYVLQVASFSNRSRARKLAAVLGGDMEAEGDLFRVRLGPFDGGDAAQRARDAVAGRGYGDARILPAN